MYYKNYILNYNDVCENLVLTELDEIFCEGYSGEWILAHTRKLYDIPRFKVENYKKYLDVNGLFLGIFPPELIQEDIDSWHKKQEEFEKDFLEDIYKMYTTIWIEKDFKDLSQGKSTLKDIIKLLEKVNRKRVNKYGLEPIDIQKEYGYYLNKYWGDEIV